MYIVQPIHWIDFDLKCVVHLRLGIKDWNQRKDMLPLIKVLNESNIRHKNVHSLSGLDLSPSRYPPLILEQGGPKDYFLYRSKLNE